MNISTNQDLAETDRKESSAGQSRSRHRWWFVLGIIVVVFGYLLWSEFMAKGVEVGDRAPEFSVTAHTGETIRLADYRGKQSVVVYFYPKDNTPVCTAEACSFRDSYSAFTDAGAVVIGISGDSAESHKEFVASRNLPFLLVSDQDGELRKAFGVPTTFGIFPGRVTYVIDQEGIVRMKFNSQLSAQRHIDEALKMVRQLGGESKS